MTNDVETPTLGLAGFNGVVGFALAAAGSLLAGYFAGGSEVLARLVGGPAEADMLLLVVCLAIVSTAFGVIGVASPAFRGSAAAGHFAAYAGCTLLGVAGYYCLGFAYVDDLAHFVVTGAGLLVASTGYGLVRWLRWWAPDLDGPLPRWPGLVAIGASVVIVVAALAAALTA